MRRWIYLAVLLFAIPIMAQSGPTYFYVATAVDVNGFESSNSNEVSCVFGPGQHNCVLTWTASVVPSGGSTIAGYNIKRSKTTGGPYVKVNTALITSGVTYTDAFVLPNAPTLAAPTVN